MDLDEDFEGDEDEEDEGVEDEGEETFENILENAGDDDDGNFDEEF